MKSTRTRPQQLEAKTLKISCVVPAHDEAAHIQEFLKALDTELQGLTDHHEIIVVDDGSTDKTTELVEALLVDRPSIRLVCFSRNFGKESALSAGLERVSGDVTILIDSDFQHPLSTLPSFLEKWAEGYEMVYGVRKDRMNETWLKRTFANNFYRLMQVMTRTKIPANAGDFRLMDRSVVNALNDIEERGLFMKGLYAWVGFKTIGIPFEVQERASGKSSWHFRRLTELALTGITAFSDVPLRIWGIIGLLISTFSFLYGISVMMRTWIYGADVPGYATIVVAIMFFGGIQLLSIGILGEYIARIFHEVKRRPKYIIAKTRNLQDREQEESQ